MNHKKMKRLKIYIDTSVIGGCFDEKFEKWSKGLILDFQNNVFKPVLSELIAAEIENAPMNVQEKYYEILKIDTDMLLITDEAINLAEIYQERKILTPKYFNDGLHIAIATISNIDIIASWNFKHIVHYDKIRLFNSVNIESGYKSIDIYSPMEVTTNG